MRKINPGNNIIYRYIIRFVLATFLLLVYSPNSISQTATEMIKDWERAKSYTREYLDAMPDSNYSFKPKPEMRSFAEHMLHFTDANYELASLAAGIINPVGDGFAGKLLDKSKTSTTRIVMDGYDFVINTIKKMQSPQFAQTIKLFGKYDMNRYTLFSKIFEHQTHHRGQTTVYLRLCSVKPPDEKLF